MNEITHKSRNKAASCEIKCSPNSLNEHFLSVSESVLKSTDNSSCKDYEISPFLKKFCQDRIGSTDSFIVPLIAVHEVGMHIVNLKNKKSMGPDNINSFLLKLALPYVVESLTHVYNLCIEQNSFPPALKAAKVIPLPKTKDLSDPNNFRPISLLSVLTKPLERNIHKHLTQFIEDRNPFLFLSLSVWFSSTAFLPHSLNSSLWHLARCNQPDPTYWCSLLRFKKSVWPC